jgi:hypothetical protein
LVVLGNGIVSDGERGEIQSVVASRIDWTLKECWFRSNDFWWHRFARRDLQTYIFI